MMFKVLCFAFLACTLVQAAPRPQQPFQNPDYYVDDLGDDALEMKLARFASNANTPNEKVNSEVETVVKTEPTDGESFKEFFSDLLQKIGNSNLSQVEGVTGMH